MATVCDVTYFIIHHEKKITNLRLNELLYYVQGIHLAAAGKPLFDEEIQAWDSGPVVASVYTEYHDQFGNNPVLSEQIAEPKALTLEEQKLLEQVLQEFGAYTGFQLVALVQKPGTPWSTARARGDHIISKKEMQDYFSKKISEEKSEKV